MTKKKIAGVVILFEPDLSVDLNILSYLNEIDKLYIVDNSEKNHFVISESLANSKIVYIRNTSNLGVAEAINIAANLAVLDSYDFLLTMDQDSSFEAQDIAELVNLANKIEANDIGIISPLHTNRTINQNPIKMELEEVDFVMTSGNLLNLKSFINVGEFLSILFIDHVDHEYCLRLRSNGYKILEAKHIHLIHSLGRLSKVNILGIIKFKFVSHSPIRLYYVVRNGFYVARKYKKVFPEFRRLSNKLVVKEFVKILFEQNKLERLEMFFLGIKHFRSSRMGKFDI